MVLEGFALVSIIMFMKKKYLVIQKGRLGWYWRLQTAKPPKVGDKIANGGQPYNNKAFCVKMAKSLLNGEITQLSQTKGMLIYQII